MAEMSAFGSFQSGRAALTGMVSTGRRLWFGGRCKWRLRRRSGWLRRRAWKEGRLLRAGTEDDSSGDEEE